MEFNDGQVGNRPAHSLYMYYVYLMRSKKTGKFYIGFTSDLRKRLSQHNTKESGTTNAYAPYELIYYEAYKAKKDAIVRENKLKHYGQGLSRLKERLRESIRIQTVCGEESPGSRGQGDG